MFTSYIISRLSCNDESAAEDVCDDKFSLLNKQLQVIAKKFPGRYGMTTPDDLGVRVENLRGYVNKRHLL